MTRPLKGHPINFPKSLHLNGTRGGIIAAPVFCNKLERGGTMIFDFLSDKNGYNKTFMKYQEYNKKRFEGSGLRTIIGLILVTSGSLLLMQGLYSNKYINDSFTTTDNGKHLYYEIITDNSTNIDYIVVRGSEGGVAITPRLQYNPVLKGYTPKEHEEYETKKINVPTEAALNQETP